jgi:signal transduction histidine kinase
MEETFQESNRISQRLRWVLLLLGLGGPVSGLVVGYGIARGLSRSIHHLSVHVQDLAQRLDQDVGSVQVAGNGDIPTLDKQLRYVAHRVEEVVERTQSHQREMLRAQQLAAVGQLAAGMAHEVRNPLTSIKMLVEAALRARNPKPFTPDALNVIHEEVIRLEHTVQSFLDFAKPPALERVECDLREVAEQSVELVRARAAKQKVEVITRAPPEPVTGVVDRGQLRTVLVNLFINALDAMPDGGRLEITTERSPARELVITVGDTGKGICRDLFDRLFTPFTSSKPTGTGLGLCVSRRIVEEHGGRLTASNRPENGAMFTILLPESR